MVTQRSNIILTAALLLPLSAHAWWQPTKDLSWQIVLSDTIIPFADVSAIDGDLFGTNASTWSDLKNSGRKAICYFSAGSSENWRPDFNQFAKSDLGSPLDGWPGENWLNTKSDNVRRIMTNRMDMAVKNGCDAIDPDNTDAYDNDNGLNLTTDDAVDYIKFLTSEGHKRGLAVGLKNSGEIVQQVVSDADFQVNEQCVQYKECDDFRPFINANKPVFGIEYVKDTPDQNAIDKICNDESRKDMSTLIKHMDLGRWVIPCPGQIAWTTSATSSNAFSNSSSVSASQTSAASTATPSTGIAAFSLPQLGGVAFALTSLVTVALL
ncbi:glycoside hydrolase family 114 protein [Acrodontium crateriforme]|uniref:alpha-galactosidase n=1 Tax=Acrodontium crateriforme TaxID=150365 RepID=A0AAQ3R4U5_9PEZI|nr:glycoside hydrolase family 114 protein [Acrodontium crateriforme]